MTPGLAVPDLARAALLAVLMATAGGASAHPLDLSAETGVAALAQWIGDYRAVAHARWVIAAADRATAEAKRAELAAHLTPIDRDLMQRVDIETNADAKAPQAWMQPALGSTGAGPKCSWQVWVADPDVPAPDDTPVMTPLAPNDRIPVGATATFRIGHAGLLQSRVYAFGETQPGAVRDLATAPDVNVPVTKGSATETILLATSRQPAPFLEELKTALADSRGERRDLGAGYSLRAKVASEGRGIGANIQVVPHAMIAAPTAVKPTGGNDPAASAMLETCLYQMAPRR